MASIRSTVTTFEIIGTHGSIMKYSAIIYFLLTLCDTQSTLQKFNKLRDKHRSMFQHINSCHEVQFRFLEPSTDYEKGIFDLLSMLTKASVPQKQDYLAHIKKMERLHNKHINIVGELNGKVVVFGTILVTNTLKGKVGKIENIVNCKSVRGKGLGKAIIQVLKDIGYAEGCRSISLFCEDKNVGFYQKMGFELKGDIYACYND